MTTWINPYLQFLGTAREAMTFYHSIFGGKLDIATGADFGVPDDDERIMHAHLETADGWTFMASDCDDTDGEGDGNPSRSLCIGSDQPTPAALEWFEALAEGGEVHIPLEKQVWGSLYGQVRDRFGVLWMFNLVAE